MRIGLGLGLAKPSVVTAFSPLNVEDIIFGYESIGAIQGTNNEYCNNAFNAPRIQYIVSLIKDLSENGWDIPQTTDALKPFLEDDVNSLPSYKFGGSYYGIHASKPTGIAAFKMYWVMNNLDTHGGGVGGIVSGINGFGRTLILDSNKYRANHDGVAWDSTGTHATNAIEIWSYEYSGSGGTQKFYRNNVLDRSGAIGTISSGTDTLAMGTISSFTSFKLRGNISAVFAYSTIPGALDDQNIWNYLSDTYGVPI